MRPDPPEAVLEQREDAVLQALPDRAELGGARVRAERVAPVDGRVDEAEDEGQRREVLRPAPAARHVEVLDQEPIDELEIPLPFELSLGREQVGKDLVCQRPTARLRGTRTEHDDRATQHRPSVDGSSMHHELAVWQAGRDGL